MRSRPARFASRGGVRRWLVVAAFLCGCGAPADDGASPHVAVVRVPRGLDFSATRAHALEEFYARHGDDYDQVVFWDTNNLLNAQFSYHPLANDVLGIGYGKTGEEVFNRGAAELGTERLQGAIWMGNRWRTIDVEPGPESALGILAEETLHRWGARVWCDRPDAPDALLDGLGLHWSAFLDVGSSPLGGVTWRPLGGSFYEARPRGAIELSDLDLYLMGVLPAAEVAPTTLLTDVFADDCLDSQPCAERWRDNPPEMVQATARAITVEQIIAAEGPRSPAAGAAPTSFRQAWAYVVYDDDEPSRADLDALDSNRLRWEQLFSQSARGLAEIRTEL